MRQPRGAFRSAPLRVQSTSNHGGHAVAKERFKFVKTHPKGVEPLGCKTSKNLPARASGQQSRIQGEKK